MLTSTRRAISYPNPDRSDRPDIPAHILNLVNALEIDVIFVQGTDAARIAAAHQTSGGKLWWTTDTLLLWYDDGTTWRALTPGALSITTAMLQDGSVTNAKLAGAIAASKLVGYPGDGTQVLWGDGHWASPAAPGVGSITSAMIADGTIVNADIAAGAAIVKSKLAALGIVDADVAVGAAIAQSKLAIPQVTMGAAPPGSPSTGDRWIYPADVANGVYWTFVYDNAQTTYKWCFIGGPPIQAEIATSEAFTASGYVDAPTPGPSVTLPRAGDYDVAQGMAATGAAGSQASFMSYSIGATAAVDADANIWQGQSASSPMRARRKTGMVAATTLTSKYKQGGSGSMTCQNRWITATPVRVI